eukprot:10119150-Karenia_brevis.AAC.1
MSISMQGMSMNINTGTKMISVLQQQANGSTRCKRSVTTPSWPAWHWSWLNSAQVALRRISAREIKRLIHGKNLRDKNENT